jgi:hypothetical protein
MGAADADTLLFYSRNAEAYAGWAKAPSARLRGFLALLPLAGSILELGCGAGDDGAHRRAEEPLRLDSERARPGSRRGQRTEPTMKSRNARTFAGGTWRERWNA